MSVIFWTLLRRAIFSIFFFEVLTKIWWSFEVMEFFWKRQLNKTMFSDTVMTLSSCFTHQSSTTEENHKDNESLKPVVLNNPEAGLSKVPPLLSSPFFYTYLTALETPYTTFKTTYVLRKWEILLNFINFDCTVAQHYISRRCVI